MLKTASYPIWRAPRYLHKYWWVSAPFVIVILLGGGCASLETAWLRHIDAPTVRPSPTRPKRLIQELAKPSIVRGQYTPAERIAAYGVYELERGNEWDAAVLMSLASYRYHQQALLAIAIGRQQMRQGRVRFDAFDSFRAYLASEAELFNDQHFDSELGLLRRHLAGISAAYERQRHYLRQLARGGARDDDFERRIEDFRSAMSSRSERLAHPALAGAVLKRLTQDHRNGDSFAFYYLAATPVDSFRLTALDEIQIPFSGLLLENVAPRLETLRAEVRRRLDSNNANTRANAAAILGLVPSEGDIAALNARLKVERDVQVADSLRFALVQNGRQDHFAPLSERAVQGYEHPLTLLYWLAPEHKDETDEKLFAAMADGQRGAILPARILAVAILGQMANRRPLRPESVNVVLGLTGSRMEELAKTATRTVGGLEQLGAEESKSLYAKHPAAHAGLLTRLGTVASLNDLSFLEEAYLDADDEGEVRTAVLIAVAGIPGVASRQLLTRWFEAAADDDSARPLMAALLAGRDDASRDEFAAAYLTASKRLMVEVAFDSARLDKIAADSIGGLDIADVAHIAMMAGLLERRAIVPTLWKLASYRKDDRYPADALVRRLAMSAIFRIVLKRRIEIAQVGPEVAR